MSVTEKSCRSPLSPSIYLLYANAHAPPPAPSRTSELPSVCTSRRLWRNAGVDRKGRWSVEEIEADVRRSARLASEVRNPETCD
jgi:hypothetical protein